MLTGKSAVGWSTLRVYYSVEGSAPERLGEIGDPKEDVSGTEKERLATFALRHRLKFGGVQVESDDLPLELPVPMRADQPNATHHQPHCAEEEPRPTIHGEP